MVRSEMKERSRREARSFRVFFGTLRASLDIFGPFLRGAHMIKYEDMKYIIGFFHFVLFVLKFCEEILSNPDPYW